MVSMFGSEPKDKGSNPLTPVMIKLMVKICRCAQVA